MKKIFLIISIGAALFWVSFVQAQNQDAIVAQWWNQEKEAQIEIYPCEGKYCGKIVWLKEPH